MVRKEHTKQKTNRRILAVILTLLLIVLAVLIFLYRDMLSLGFLTEKSEGLASMVSQNEPFTYETGSQQMFSLMGDSLVVASSTGLQLLDEKGETISREVFSMSNPAVCASSSTCAVYDVGGFSLRIYKDGEFQNLDRDSEIISVSVNGDGYYAVAGFEAGYKGSVKVYNSNLDPVYEWFSGSGYILDAAVSPDNSSLACLCLESSGTVVHLFHLDSEEEQASVTLPDEMAFKLSFEKGGNFCILSESSMHFYNLSGNELSSYDFGEGYLANYELSEDCWAVVVSKYVSGSDVSLLSFENNGKIAGTAQLSSEPLSLFSRDDKLLLLGASDVILYSGNLHLQNQNHVSAGFVSAVLLSKGSVLLLSSHYGEKCAFS